VETVTEELVVEEVTSAPPTHDWLEVVATLLLALAAVATAWASYQATRWNGEQTKASSRTTALRIQASSASALAESQTQIDVATFIQWVDAKAHGDEALQQFYEARFRPEFVPAFQAWLATDPLTNPDAPPTPFAMKEYAPAARTDADSLERRAEASSAVVQRNVQRSADYVLGVVLFAAALFFAGMSTKLHAPRLRAITLGIGCLIFVGTAIYLATLPVVLSM
jgi:hypothetical protein